MASLPEIAFVLGTIALLGFILWSTHQTARLLQTARITQNLLLLPAENGFKLLLILLSVLLGRLSGARFTALGWVAPTWRDVLMGVGWAVAAWLPLNAAMWFSVRRWGPGVYSPVVLRNILPRTRAEWLLVPLALIPAAVSEELLFRSLVLGGMERWVPPILLVVAASVLFGAAHTAQGRIAPVLTGALSVLLALLFLWTHSLTAVCTAHWALNVLQLVTAAAHREELERLHPEDAKSEGPDVVAEE